MGWNALSGLGNVVGLETQGLALGCRSLPLWGGMHERQRRDQFQPGATPQGTWQKAQSAEGAIHCGCADGNILVVGMLVRAFSPGGVERAVGAGDGARSTGRDGYS